MVTVYTKPSGCVQCDLTKKVLDSHGIDYTSVDATTPENMEFLKGLGYMQVPVVFVGDQHWSGFQPERIKRLSEPVAA